MGPHCAVDLHGNNGYYGIVDEMGRRLLSKRLPNSLDTVLTVLEPYREQLDAGVVVTEACVASNIRVLPAPDSADAVLLNSFTRYAVSNAFDPQRS